MDDRETSRSRTSNAPTSRRGFLKAAPLLGAAPYVLGAEATQSSKPAALPATDAAAVEELLKVVPEPIVPERPDLLALYEACWRIGLQQSEQGTPANGFVRWYVDAAFDNRIFQWDTAFSLAWAKYGQGALPSIESIDNFYRKQHPDGAISGVIEKADGEDDQPKNAPWFTRNNLFSWIEWEYYRTTGDRSRLARVVPILADYATWVIKNRRHANGHYFWSGWSSGMDNSPRSIANAFYPPYSWVDCDANEALAARYLVKMAEAIGDEQTAERFRKLHQEIKELVNEEMWSEDDRFYWDLDEDGSFMKVMTVASFWPMWAKITDERHVDGLLAHLNNPTEFNRPHRVPTLAAKHPAYSPVGDYWRGSVWAPTNHMIVKGLTANGRYRAARAIVCNHLDNMSTVFQETGTVWENYAPERPAPGEPARADFVGWSADGPIAQLIENYIGITLDVPNDRIRWNLLTTEEVGLRNLDFGGYTIALKARRRSAPEEAATLEVRTPVALIIELYDGETTTDLHVPPGEHVINAGQQTSNRSRDSAIPQGLRLGPNYPNPFREETTIEYSVAHHSVITLAIYDILGRRVQTLTQEKKEPGRHTVSWNGRTVAGDPAASGSYVYQLTTSEGHRLSKRMTLLR